MNINHIIHCWLNGLHEKGCQHEPAFLPLTREEVEEVKHNAIFYTPPGEHFDPSAPTKIYGMPLHETEYAVEQRARQLEVPYLHLAETSRPMFDCIRWENPETMRVHMSARVCAETTTLRVTFEWDCWAGVKRALRITRWFPVKSRSALIDGRVLYPFLQVGLPHNRHSVQFRIKP